MPGTHRAAMAKIFPYVIGTVTFLVTTVSDSVCLHLTLSYYLMTLGVTCSTIEIQR